MSRAASSMARKKDQKEAIALKNADAEKKKAMGLTNTLAKQVKNDTVICSLCGATELGGVKSKCECVGGRTKPANEDINLACLIAAANGRHAERKAETMNEALKAQTAKSTARSKKKEARGVQDSEIECQGDLGTELVVVAEFLPGKLGMDFEKNCIIKVTEGGAAEEAGVKVGWVLQKVGDTPMPANKGVIGKAIMACFKENNPAACSFRVPIDEATYVHCAACDKFQVKDDEFDTAELEKGPGKQQCTTCEEFSGMF